MSPEILIFSFLNQLVHMLSAKNISRIFGIVHDKLSKKAFKDIKKLRKRKRCRGVGADRKIRTTRNRPWLSYAVL